MVNTETSTALIETRNLELLYLESYVPGIAIADPTDGYPTNSEIVYLLVLIIKIKRTTAPVCTDLVCMSIVVGFLKGFRQILQS